MNHPIHDDLRTLKTWLNEELVAPIDRPTLARVLLWASQQTEPTVEGMAKFSDKMATKANNITALATEIGSFAQDFRELYTAYESYRLILSEVIQQRDAAVAAHQPTVAAEVDHNDAPPGYRAVVSPQDNCDGCAFDSLVTCTRPDTWHGICCEDRKDNTSVIFVKL